MQDWDHFRFILALHRSGTIRGAAAELGVNHATVSRRLALIQGDPREPIFERSAGKYVITRSGKPLLMAAQRIETTALQAERQRRSLNEVISGPITLSMAETTGQFLLHDALLEFAELYPNIDLTVASTYRRVDLDRSEADVVIRGDNAPPEHLVGQKVSRYALTYYAHEDYVATTPPDQRRWLSFAKAARPLTWLSESPFPDAPIKLRIGDLTLLHQMACAGQGMIYSACFMCDPSEDLVRLSDRPPVPSQDFWVLTHPDLRKSPRINALMEFLVDAMAKKRNLIEGNL